MKRIILLATILLTATAGMAQKLIDLAQSPDADNYLITLKPQNLSSPSSRGGAGGEASKLITSMNRKFLSLFLNRLNFLLYIKWIDQLSSILLNISRYNFKRLIIFSFRILTKNT